MAPIANNNNIRQTGTVPKAKSQKNSVPQEIVVPTRRDLQQHLNELVGWAPVSQNSSVNFSKPHNNRTPGEGASFDIDNLSLQDSSRFIPVRPIVRRNMLQEEINESIPSNQNNTTIGIVIPTQPLQQSAESFTGFSGPARTRESSQNFNGPHRSQNLNQLSRAHVEEKITQIQEYIKITSSLLNSMQLDDSITGGAHSISSINTNQSTPNTPLYDELRAKSEQHIRNMQSIKDQQNQLQCLQQIAKQQLFELEKVRAAQGDKLLANQTNNGLPNYETVEQVQDDASNLMNRMKTLTNFIQNQNDLSSLLGEDGEEILAEQMMLQKKLLELKTKKQQMDNLVAELSSLNAEEENHVEVREPTPQRSVPNLFPRSVPSEIINGSNNIHFNHDLDQDRNKSEENETVAEDLDSPLGDKIAEINAMKEQLKRLKHMMDTVKLIEMKTGVDIDVEEEDDDDESPGESHEIYEVDETDKSSEKLFIHPEHDEKFVIQISEDSENKYANRVPVNIPMPLLSATAKQTNEHRDETINQRVFELQSMTQDLRQQAISLATQRDKIRLARDEMKREKESVEKRTNQYPINTLKKRSVSPKEREKQLLTAKLDSRKMEYEKLLKSIEKVTENTNDTKRNEGDMLYFHDNWADSQMASAIGSSEKVLTPKVKAGSHSNTPGKDTVDSGRKEDSTDMLSVNIEAGSVQSGSTRSFSMPPPMPSLPERSSNWRKTSHDHSTLSSSGNHHHQSLQQQTCCMSSRGHYSPWMLHHQPYNQSNDCQSPLWHHPMPQLTSSHPAGQDYLHCYPYCYPHIPTDNSMFQEFLHTQQMLVNTICKCNELLWSQQKEINSLNNAVLWLQERFVPQNQGQTLNLDSLQQQGMRAESVPTSVPANIQNTYFSRAHSEQPTITNPGQNINIPPISPNRFYHQNNINQSSFNLRNQNNQRSQSNIQLPYNVYQNTNEIIGNRSTLYPNYYIQTNIQQPLQNELLTQSQPTPAEALNNIALPQNSEAQPIFIHHNNNINNNNNKILHQQQNLIASANSNLTANNAFNPTGPSALNNQVPPGNRANNYWDNFRSYSRQNLLSSSSCKSNDGSCSLTSSNFHQQNANADRLALRNNQQQPSMTYNNLPNHFRNQFNQLNVTPAQHHNFGININQQHSQQEQTHTTDAGVESLNDNVVSNNFNNQSNIDSSINLCGHSRNADRSSDSSHINGLLQFHINSTNLIIDDHNKKMKSIPKGNDNNNKKPIAQQLRIFDLNNLYDIENNQNVDVDLNLANRRPQLQNINNNTRNSNINNINNNSNTNNNNNSNNNNNVMKPTSKIFDALRENVYSEVSALIAANETRPQFLIQLFRDLQLISSDPLRQRTLQSIQDLYSRYIETIVQEEPIENHRVRVTSNSTTKLQERIASNQNNTILREQPNFSCPQPTLPPPTTSTHDVVTIIMHDISKYLQNIDNINENSLQRISSMALTHLNNPNNNYSKSNFNFDEITKNLTNINHFDKNEFLLNVEYYLNNLLLKNNESNIINESLPSQEENDDSYMNENHCEPQLVLIDINFGNNPNNCNEDLAEADQVCSSENSYINDDGSFEEGAVGGNTEIISELEKLSVMMNSKNTKELTNSNDAESSLQSTDSRNPQISGDQIELNSSTNNSENLETSKHAQ